MLKCVRCHVSAAPATNQPTNRRIKALIIPPVIHTTLDPCVDTSVYTCAAGTFHLDQGEMSVRCSVSNST